MAQDVLCSVSNCTYWGEGNKCNASSINVVSFTGSTAANQNATDCQTFVKR